MKDGLYSPKPPRGIVPRQYYDAMRERGEADEVERRADLLRAIRQYRAAGLPFPDEWMQEVKDIDNGRI